ncbi:DUF2442 domain-containing protein [Adhaeribacter pallidiroseus]|uniref:DUF2442 domain-containing protein n=1 Tax=Adhaeribacter pallidiroseus TaxID=2072847 RepID=A0A369QNQ7_9BACT|nr:DUF2442 domain-containing protein [Adhaeribacter pallidiroseus]RDC65972.1 hypothetical protein AHMF7616_04603 [Adhaeribacter pallidiroseus]
MNLSANKKIVVTANQVWFADHKLYVLLHDGRELGIPLEWFPKLSKATEAERQKYRLIGNGIGICWESLDEDLSVSALL